MEILSVSLKNFKSHRDRHFVFQPGTNAICGENGAGKTSILEAIAWVLFDYAGDYTKTDLIRNGAASAQVRVAFVSNRDHRTYEVQRCTSKSYTLYDPQLNERLPYTRIKEDVQPWLRDHLGVSPGTDLSQLFSSMIGVPQGTFTVDFLLTKEKRKPIFDKILKVEEYQQSWKRLGELEKYAKHQVERLEQTIAHHEADLADLVAVRQRQQEQQQAIEHVTSELQQAQAKLTQLQQEQAYLSEQATTLHQLDGQLETLTARMQAQTETVARLKGELEQAEQAVAICTANREAYQAVLQAEATLKALEQQQRQERDLQRQRQQQLEQCRDRQTQLATLTHQIDRLQAAATEITQLTPLIEQQQQLEQAIQVLNQKLHHIASWQQAATVQATQLAQTQARCAQLAQEIARIQRLEPAIQQIPHLEQQQQRYQQQLSRIAAAAQFETELRQLLTQAHTSGDRYHQQVQQAAAVLTDLQQAMPLWADALNLALATLHSGRDWQQSLLSALQGILTDLASQTAAAKLEQALQQLQADLQLARQQQVEFANLERRLADYDRLQVDVTELTASLSKLHTQLADETALRQEHTHLTNRLDALGDPRGLRRLRQQEQEQEPDLQQRRQALQQSLAADQQAIAALDQQLLAFADITSQLELERAVRDRHRPAYTEYLEHQKLANSRRDRQQQVQTALTQLEALQQETLTLTATRDRLEESFDRAHFQTVQTTYQQIKDQCVALNASLPDKQAYLDALNQQLERLAAIQNQRDQAQRQLDQKRQAQRFIKFARDAYKKAGPRITGRYVQSISREADRLYRELLNRPNVRLEWTQDYDILVQEGAHTRRFINLSGGEQMCAALAVRLALLKVLADIDVAFFDEPTTNMDKPRREHLAEAIANIKNFRQLFVISHDDTFEKVTENVIVVERETD